MIIIEIKIFIIIIIIHAILPAALPISEAHSYT